MTMYFFHNVYDDEEGLLKDLPEGIEAVPFGWTPEEEQYRNNLLNSLNASVSSLPCLLVFVPEHFINADNFSEHELLFLPQDHRVSGWHKVPAKWVQFPISIMAKPWTWEKILQSVRSYHV